MIPRVYERYEKSVMVATFNFLGIWGDKSANLRKIKTHIEQASQLGAKIISFPELALSGYECGGDVRRKNKPCSMHIRAAETIPGPTTEDIAKLTRKLGIYVILGMPEKDSRDSTMRHNSAAIIGPKGLIGTYRKIHLVPLPMFTETLCFKPGKELPVFETQFGPIGVLICCDFWFVPELTRLLYLKGARIIFNLAGSLLGPGKSNFMIQQTGCRATESLIYTVSCNHVGKEKTLSYYGGSTIAGPLFPRLNKIFAKGGTEEEMVSATLSFEALHLWQNYMNVKEIGNWKLIADEYKKFAEGVKLNV